MSTDVKLTVSSDYLRVNPGEEVQLTINVHNESIAIDIFKLEVDGLEENWGTPDVLAQRLFPHPGRPGDPHRDCNFESTLVIRPPRNTTSRAGTRQLEIKARRDQNPNEPDVQVVTLEVLPFYAYNLDLSPQRRTGSRGEYDISIANEGGAALNFELKGRDPDELCRFIFEHEVPQVQSGETANVKLTVEPSQRPLWGRPRPYNFTITATPRMEGLEAKELTGTLNATSRWGQSMSRTVSALRRPIGTPRIPSFPIPTWVLILCGMVLITVITLAIIYAFTPKGGGGTAFDIPPGEGASYALSLPDSRTVRIEGLATLDVSGSGGDLEMVLERPDGTRAVVLALSPNTPQVAFTLDQEIAAGQAGESWMLSLHNGSASDNATGTLEVNTAGIR